METECSGTSPQVRSISAKAAYSKAARKKLIESRAKINRVMAAIKHATASGSLKSGEKLAQLQRVMGARFAVAEARLEALQKSGEEEWTELRDEVEDAREDLSSSIRALVARIRDESA